ncbi:hypothetical protein F5B22DRAFT_644644 [Xylaria bambusicola]|uniref:uncharacterized protein n=1 Tax=Xylaria bambusicola TaxID=326684 RepID=UPI0020076F24|nr:uncharacterized protein F5B22DRAFT_644644 [Xylaria bambusicola]KAI0520903.1 hypothetical protein F5B22DRAFT_644644 [Xylaria bambusicola]
MDGPSSRFTSMSVSSGTNVDLRASFPSVPRQSLKELFPSVSAPPTTGIDPPRPAKEGHEWVWFPAGYWAEREIVEVPRKELSKAFGWRKRSGKSASASAKRSSHTSTSFPEKMEAWSEHSASGRLLTRTAASSESGGSLFPLNRMPDAPLPSPYLTEETHVQSLQWPSIDAAARRSSTSGSSVFKSRGALSPSPLHLSHAEAEIESESVSPATVRGQPPRGASSDTINTVLLTPPDITSPKVRPKKSFITWRMLSQHRQRLRRSQASSKEKLGEDGAQIQSSRHPGATASPLRKTSNISDKSRKSLKGFPTKLLRRARWSRKISNSSAVSTSSSMQTTSVNSHSPDTPGSERGETAVSNANAWASEYPGNEAIRVQTPRIEQFPRSFFQDLSAPTTPRRPLSRQEGQLNLKKTNLSTSFTPGGDSSNSTTPGRQRNEHRSENDADSSSSTKLRTPSSSRKPRKDRAHKEWWEVTVPTSYAEVDQRTFQFDLPEHLPTSPMCPANKRHKSGGTGVCVYHGRAKSRDTSAVTSGESEREEAGREQDVYEEDEGNESDVWK